MNAGRIVCMKHVFAAGDLKTSRHRKRSPAFMRNAGRALYTLYFYTLYYFTLSVADEVLTRHVGRLLQSHDVKDGRSDVGKATVLDGCGIVVGDVDAGYGV